EPLQVIESGARAVVIAADHHRAMIPHPIHHQVRIGGISYQVAAADGLVVFAFGLLNNGFQGFPVGVEIAEDEIAHGDSVYTFLNRRTEISGGAPIRAGMPMVPMPRVT